MTTYIATDGSCTGTNGAGFGIASDRIRIAGPVKNYTVRNVSYPNIHYDVNSPQKGTNNRGELLAILYAIHYIRTLDPGSYVIVSDSNYAIKCVTEWYHNWVLKGITDKKNMDLITLIVDDSQIAERDGYKISFMHQKAHLSLKEMAKLSPASRRNAELNDMADKLAGEGWRYDKPIII